jgi:hypothetical protein
VWPQAAATFLCIAVHSGMAAHHFRQVLN